MADARDRRAGGKRPASGPRPAGKAAELALLYEISRLLDSSLDLRAVVEPVLETITHARGLEFTTLTLCSRQTGDIVIEAAFGLSASQKARGRYRRGEGITGAVIQTGTPAIVPSVFDDPVFLDRTGARRQRGRDSSFLCVPIRTGREVLGALSADRAPSATAVLREEARVLSVIAALIAQAVKLRQSAQEERERLVEENLRLRDELDDRYRPPSMVGNSREMQAVYRLIARVSASDTTVLVRGESGTGKELVAQAIHQASARAHRPFVTVSCAALSEGLIESELFGHEPGAFTGAVSAKRGRFQLAEGGTLFLDEVGDLSPMVQVKLLRVLQEREYERVGGTATIRADVRVIAATHRNLEQLVEAGQMRPDLYYRLNVFPIHVPPLRERRSDILLLADHFVERYAERNSRKVARISTPAIDLLMAYHWPGNVRELQHCIERAVLLSQDEVIHGHHLPAALQGSELATGSSPGTLASALESVERELLVEALKSCRGNVAAAAESLGISRRVMGLRVLKYRISPRRFKP